MEQITNTYKKFRWFFFQLCLASIYFVSRMTMSSVWELHLTTTTKTTKESTLFCASQNSWSDGISPGWDESAREQLFSRQIKQKKSNYLTAEAPPVLLEDCPLDAQKESSESPEGCFEAYYSADQVWTSEVGRQGRQEQLSKDCCEDAAAAETVNWLQIKNGQKT